MKFKDIISTIANEKTNSLHRYFFFYLLAIIVIIMLSSLILSALPFVENSLQIIRFGIFLGIILFPNYITCWLFYKKNNRIFNQQEYRSFLKGANIIMSIFLILQTILAIMLGALNKGSSTSSFVVTILLFTLLFIGSTLLLQRFVIRSSMKLIYNRYMG